jgi:hypothetical protein
MVTRVSCVKSVLETLGAYLAKSMPSLTQVLYEFPSPNVALKYPSLSIVASNPSFMPMMPYELSQGDTKAHKASIKTVIGAYDLKLQLDFWCRDKLERFGVYEEFFDAFNPNPEVGGLNLTMADYHGIICRYDLQGYNLKDDEAASQRSEWRAMVNVLANTRAIKEKPEYIIETIENDLSFPKAIEG